MEESKWNNVEAFFWREESCFPWLEYKVELDYNDVDEDDESFEETRMLLPGTLTVEDIRCMSIWSLDTEVGYTHLAWPRRLPKAG